MNTLHLTDREFIDYCLKFETDPKIVRMASIMDRMPGHILDGLEDAGMDRETCLYENTYDPGQYVRHLLNEIEYLNDELEQAQNKIADMETKTVLELIHELRTHVDTATHERDRAYKQINRLQEEQKELQNKMDMWAILNR